MPCEAKMPNRGEPQTTNMGLLGPASTGTWTMAFNPTFGSFTLLELVSH